jgi:CBS-domain-containing membrane protein
MTMAGAESPQRPSRVRIRMAATAAEITERDAPAIALGAAAEDVLAQLDEQDVPALPVVADRVVEG